jgi:hypothetical protein
MDDSFITRLIIHFVDDRNYDSFMVKPFYGARYNEGGVTKELQFSVVISSSYISSWSFLIQLLL